MVQKEYLLLLRDFYCWRHGKEELSPGDVVVLYGEGNQREFRNQIRWRCLYVELIKKVRELQYIFLQKEKPHSNTIV